MQNRTHHETEIIELTHRLIDSIVSSDWETYTQLCAEDLTAYEPEANGHLVEGMAFHKHYFDMQDASPYANVTTTLSSPSVRMIGKDAAMTQFYSSVVFFHIERYFHGKSTVWNTLKEVNDDDAVPPSSEYRRLLRSLRFFEG